MQKTTFTLHTSDNYPITVTSFQPENPNQKVVLLNGANAIKQSFYEAFATFWAEKGYWVYTYDYRGVGLSKPPQIAHFQATMTDWVEKDWKAVFDYVLQNHPLFKKIVVGHSFGGQIVGWLPIGKEIDALLLVASQTGYWKNWEGKGRWMMYAVSHLLFPTASKIWGYLPARFGLGEDLPKGVAIEWAKWCRSRNYLFDYIEEKIQNYQLVKNPTLSINFTDDTYAPTKSVEALLAFYSKAQIEKRIYDPKELNVKKIGHFGFFKKKYADLLWIPALEWLEQKLASDINQPLA